MVIYSKPPDFYIPPGQDVQGKTAQELSAIKNNRLFNSVVAVIFSNKSYFSVVNT
jgi:hypothetical protein